MRKKKKPLAFASFLKINFREKMQISRKKIGKYVRQIFGKFRFFSRKISFAGKPTTRKELGWDIESVLLSVTTWRARRCPWKKKLKKIDFLSYNTPRPPMSVYKNFSPAIRNIYERLVLLYRRFMVIWSFNHLFSIVL